MIETDTRLCPNCGVTLNGYSGLRHCGTYTTHSHADCIRNLAAMQPALDRAERDTVWNDAIESAAELAERGHHPRDIRALKKGDTP